MRTLRGDKGLTVVVLLGMMAGMVALVVASVPLYQLFCRLTGYGGTPQVAASASDLASERTMKVRFDAGTNGDLPWRFEPRQREVTVHLGENVLAWYSAENTSNEPIVGTATFNVTPAKAGRYFNKIECFCFSEQLLNPGERMDLPVTFFVDPAINGDATTDEVGTITLSYTFFRARNARLGAAPPPPNPPDGPS